MNKKKTIKFAENSQRSITGKGDDACVKEKRLSVEPTNTILLFWFFGHHAYVFGSSPLSIGQHYAEIYKTHE